MTASQKAPQLPFSPPAVLPMGGGTFNDPPRCMLLAMEPPIPSSGDCCTPAAAVGLLTRVPWMDWGAPLGCWGSGLREGGLGFVGVVALGLRGLALEAGDL